MKTRFFILISLVGLIACKPDLEQVQLEVSVSSGIKGVSLEGYKVKVFGPETMVSSIDADGKAYFDFEAPLGETYLVKFMDNFENFNPQGISITSNYTVEVNGTFEVPHDRSFSLKVLL